MTTFDDAANRQQVHWEYEHLRGADIVLFWFPQDAVQPIALYELGTVAAGAKPMVVGADATYPRKRDVIFQLALARPEVHVLDSLDLTVGRAVALLDDDPAQTLGVTR